MNEKDNKSTLVPVNAKFLIEARKNSTTSEKSSISSLEKDERTRKEFRKIRDLDVSIREMDLKLKIARAETLDLQSKNRAELTKKLLLESPKTGTIAKNTRRFLELFADLEVREKSEDTTHMTLEPEEIISMTEEEKGKLVFLMNEENFDPDDTTANTEAALNPYTIDESSRQFLNEIEEKLKVNSNDEKKFV